MNKHTLLGLYAAPILAQLMMGAAAGMYCKMPKKPSKTYAPNGAKECARRVRQIERGTLKCSP